MIKVSLEKISGSKQAYFDETDTYKIVSEEHIERYSEDYVRNILFENGINAFKESEVAFYEVYTKLRLVNNEYWEITYVKPNLD